MLPNCTPLLECVDTRGLPACEYLIHPTSHPAFTLCLVPVRSSFIGGSSLVCPSVPGCEASAQVFFRNTVSTATPSIPTSHSSTTPLSNDCIVSAVVAREPEYHFFPQTILPQCLDPRLFAPFHNSQQFMGVVGLQHLNWSPRAEKPRGSYVLYVWHGHACPARMTLCLYSINPEDRKLR
ncbi:hypothetical protein JAAARDRAFT_531593 [Jaapia argillacea MUCL 33604]|uniref:Uncharacterized protein n=1 Tax=Jaapia argillacea MUCL 33604 TaxID=933084 RepID=A0A067PBV0_9AGAM|nr:hypothetical protein JAAARDRAFT_531593 [Jaapia argillacea MUCL 33604]